MRVDEATKLCPQLHTPHVPVIGEGASPSSRSASNDNNTAASSHLPNRSVAKVSLERYREESQKIFTLLESLAPTLERASIDEAYIDVTDIAADELAHRRHDGEGSLSRWAETTEWVRQQPTAAGAAGAGATTAGSDVGAGDARWYPDASDPIDATLLAAAAVCERLRRSVREATGYRMSAGIAHSKMVAKIASATHKPDKQTIIPRAAVPLVMGDLPLSDVRGLGGQLGQQVSKQLGIERAGQLAHVPLERLKALFGSETATWLAAVATGGLDEPVLPTIAPKSLNAFKSFGATRDGPTILRWVGLLAAELVERMASDKAARARVPRKLRVQYRGSLDADHKQKLEFGPAGSWLVVKRFVTEAERAALLRKSMVHMQRQELFPNPSGPGRFFAKADDDPACYVDALLERLTRRCERCLRMREVNADCVLGRTISFILPGGFIHRHTDAYREGQPGHRPGLDHMRCNIMVKMADPSGQPVVEGRALPVEEGDLWAFFASRSQHETRPLQGSEPRIIFGFGWSVAPHHKFERPPDGFDAE